jgi:hypothetical protein
MAIEVSNRRLLSALALAGALFAGVTGAGLGTCGPFGDAAADAFCPFILEVLTVGITTGTTATTYDPGGNVTRIQMAAFLSRTVDGVLRRGSQRAAARKFYNPQTAALLGTTTVGGTSVRFDGADLWAPNASTVVRIRASDARPLETWTGAAGGEAVVGANGRIVVAGGTPGKMFLIDPRLPAGAVTTVASNLPNSPQGIEFDGSHVWTANTFGSSLSIVTPGASIPWTVTNVNITIGSSAPIGLAFDGSNMWATDASASAIVKLDTSGTVLQTVTVSVGGAPYHPVFDGTNLWVPNQAPSAITVVRASSGAILQTLTGNGLSDPYEAAFDGERILVTNQTAGTISLWKAADLAPMGSFPISTGPSSRGATSDGLNFWIVTAVGLVRF